ncbi:MAG: hypothetical protein N2C14_22290, partial [Planctomycetales bacterium]
FQAMHLPRKKITLDEICEWTPKVKEKNPNFQMGFSFVVTWKGALRDDTKVVENIHEIRSAAERAKKYQFDYISVKPFLVRAEENGSEVMNPDQAEGSLDQVVRRIRQAVEEARQLESDSFRVIESTNLRVLEQRTWKEYTKQTKNCHMQHFRQVLTPHGVFNCPVYRSVVHARIADRKGYLNPETIGKTQDAAADLIDGFDASCECKEVTCLYHGANWWLEELIKNPEKVNDLSPTESRGDYYL